MGDLSLTVTEERTRQELTFWAKWCCIGYMSSVCSIGRHLVAQGHKQPEDHILLTKYKLGEYLKGDFQKNIQGVCMILS